jgi:uncharacterized protein YutE (UPF0331/DUF86 family)
LAEGDGLPADLRDQLIAACGMRNVLKHLYDIIDLDRVTAAVDPAIALYERFAAWAATQSALLTTPSPSSNNGSPPEPAQG